MGDMAFNGAWRPFFEFIAETLRRFASNRDKQKGEAFVHGFTLAHTCLTKLYLPVSELDAGAKTTVGETVTGGYADIYLQPMLDIFPDIEHSYVLELKYLPCGGATSAVGAGPVPARLPGRANVAGDSNACAPKGASGWHRACPYIHQFIVRRVRAMSSACTMSTSVFSRSSDQRMGLLAM